MHWDPKGKWSSATKENKPHLNTGQRQARRELIKQMSLFRKKKVEGQVSAFDQIPPEVQAKILEDILSIVRTVKAWPGMIPPELTAGMGNEVSTLLRKTGLKLAGAFMSNDDKGFAQAFEGVQLPLFAKQVILAVQFALADKFTPEPPAEGPDGKAA